QRDPDSRVTWEITPLGATCKLTVVHEHASADTTTAQGTVRGWSMILSGLKTLLETGTPLQIAEPEEARA
ncbi:MAG TPA: SRPBCC domain-containing protein, partial [Candidatus Acidoferrum sp.]|nr:SRPBCC domain-containing protein [Candidatus Acidoferrum sp.]